MMLVLLAIIAPDAARTADVGENRIADDIRLAVAARTADPCGAVPVEESATRDAEAARTTLPIILCVVAATSEAVAVSVAEAAIL
jgi:hypothetical protein